MPDVGYLVGVEAPLVLQLIVLAVGLGLAIKRRRVGSPTPFVVAFAIMLVVTVAAIVQAPLLSYLPTAADMSAASITLISTSTAVLLGLGELAAWVLIVVAIAGRGAKRHQPAPPWAPPPWQAYPTPPTAPPPGQPYPTAPPPWHAQPTPGYPTPPPPGQGYPTTTPPSQAYPTAPQPDTPPVPPASPQGTDSRPPEDTGSEA